MATKKKEKTVQELLREKQLEQIENFSIDDGEEEHSLDQILEAASQQGLLELYNPFEERAKKIAEEEVQAPKRPSEAQTARQTFDQLGNLGNMVKKTEAETLPKITNEAIKNYNLSKTGRDYLSKYDDSTSYADIQKDIAEVQGKREEDSSNKDAYDLALAMLKDYVNQNYDLNGTDLSQEAIKRRQEVYDYNQNEIDNINSKVEANKGDTESLNLDDEETVSKYLNHDKDAVDFFIGYRSGRITQDAANQEKYITMRNYIENAANSDSVRDLRNEVENLRAQNAAYDRTQGQSDRYALQYGDEVKNEKTDLLTGTLHTRNNVPDNFDERVENGNDRFTDMGDISQPAIKRYGGENAVEDYNNMDAHTEMLTSEEKGIYSYLLRNEGEVSANAYLDSLKDVLQKRASETTQEYIDNASGAEKAVLLAASVPMNVYGTVTGFAEDAANIAAGKDIHPYSESHSMYNIAQQTRSSVAEDIDEATNSWNVLGFSAGDAFQAAMSIPDFMLGSLTPSYYAASMSMGAAQSTAKELWDEGATNEQIVAESVLSGAAEYVFEKVSLDKILDTADKSKLVKSALAGMAVEGSEEANTEIANIISDVLVRGSQSEWNKMIQSYKDQGYSDSEAQVKAFSDMAKRVGYSAIGGAIGGAGGGAGVAIEKGAGYIQDKSERNKYIASVGADVTNAGNTQALLDTADQMKDNAEVQAQAEKVRQAQTNNAEKGTESSAKALSRETGKLYAAIQENNAQGIQNAEANEIKAAIKQAYAAETGEDANSDTVTQAAEAIYKSEYTGEKLTRTERNLASTSQAQSAVESVRNNPDLIEQSTQKAQERAFNKYISTAQLTQKQETKSDKDVDIAEFNVHEDDNKVYTADGKNQVDIASVASIGKNDITFALKDGQTESAKALDMPTKQAVIAQSVIDVQKDMGVELTPEIADTLYKGYEQSNVKSVSAYMQDAKKVLFNGYTNNTKIDNTINLPQGLRNRLYSMGRQLAASHTQAQQQEVNNRVKGNKTRKGSVTFVDGIRRGQLDARRRAGVDTVENLANSLGFDVVFYRSTKNGKGRYSSEYVRKNKFTADGQQAPSGFWRGGKMYLDINAGMNGEGLILFTASHELVHMIREGSPEAFQELADFLVKNYAEQGVNINDLVLKEMSKSTNLTRDEAFEEVIAESCETFLRDIHLNDKAQELYKQNPSLWSRIREALKRIINSIKEAYAVARPQSEEARITNRADIETLEKAYDLWTKGIIKSSENLRNMESERTDTKYQGRAETQDTEYLDAVERGDMEKAQKMVDEAAEKAGYNTPMLYHGTQRFGFTEFDLNKMDDGISIFLTSTEETASTYSGVTGSRGVNETTVKSYDDLQRMSAKELVDEANRYNKRFHNDASDVEYRYYSYDDIKTMRDETEKKLKQLKPAIQEIGYKYANKAVENFDDNYHEAHGFIRELLKVIDNPVFEKGHTSRDIANRYSTLGADIEWLVSREFKEFNTDEYKDLYDTLFVLNEIAEEKLKGKEAIIKVIGEDGIKFYIPENVVSLRNELLREVGSGNYGTFAKLQNPLVIEADGSYWNRIPISHEIWSALPGLDRHWDRQDREVSNTRAISAYAKDNGYDGVIFKNLDDNGGRNNLVNKAQSDVYVVFDSAQVKSADPVTYDNDGNVIPLSERFNESNKDIRYQSRYRNSATDDAIGYRYAVKNGDTARAQKIVDRTANRVFANSKVRGKDGKLRKVYHYTNTDFYSFDTGRSGKNQGQTHGDGIYVSTSPDEFSYAGKKRMALYANITNPFEMELTEEQARHVLEKYAAKKHNLDGYDGLYRNHAMRALQSSYKVFDYLKEYAEDNDIKVSDILKDLGYDGVHDGSEWVAFSSEQLKSADPITYDDDGKVIPLSQRFDTARTDIRYKNDRVDENQFQDFEISDWEYDDTTADTIAREYVSHHEDIGEVLKNIADIDITPAKVTAIVNRVLRENIGTLDKTTRELLSTEVQIALDRVNRDDPATVINNMTQAVRDAIENAYVPSEKAEADYKELLSVFKGKRFYLSEEQLNYLKEHDSSLGKIHRELQNRVNIVDKNNLKRSINGGYQNAQELSLEGLYDVLESPDEYLSYKRDEWDEYGYKAPFIIRDALNKLRDMRSQRITEVYSSNAIDDMAVTLSAKITGGIVEAKYNSRKNPYITKLVNDLKAKRSEAVKKQKEKYQKKLSELKQKERERAAKRERELSDKYKEQRERGRENRKRTEFRNKIRKLMNSFQSKLTKPRDGSYVPRELIAQTVDVLNSINMDTGRSVNLSEKIAALRNTYDGLRKDAEAQAIYNDTISEMLRGLSVAIKNTSIMDMSLEQLQMVYDALRSLDHYIRESVKMTDTEEKRSAHALGRAMIAETREASGGNKGILSGYVQAQLRADVMFNRLGGFKKNSTWLQMARMLNDGQLHMTQLQMEFSKIFADVLTDIKQLRTLSNTKNLIDIGLVDDDGKTVKITRGMMLSLYMHLLNEDNTRHVMGGGLTVPGIKEYYKGDLTKAFGEKQRSVRVGQIDFTEYAEGIKTVIEEQLTDYEKVWIGLAHEFFDDASRNAINDTTMKLYGFKRATVTNYFPIHTDSNYRAASFESITRDMSLENSGFMKERIKASNPILLEDIVDVINDQIQKVSKYCGLTIPINNFQKVYGTTLAGYESSLQKEINKKFSGSKSNTSATKYIDNLITDLTSGRQTSEGPFAKFFTAARGNLAKATLTINARVAIAQAASYPTAAAEIGWKPLLKAAVKGGRSNRMFSRADRAAIEEVSPLLWLRTQGYSNTEIGDIKELRKQKHKIEGKFKKAMGWIEFFDGMTVGRLYYAAQYAVDEKYPSLKRGTEEYKQKVAEVYNDIIEKTQPNYTVLQRPDILRNPNAVVKSLTMFMTQRLQNFNIVYDAAGTYNKYRKDFKSGKNGVTALDVKEAGTKLRRAVISQVVASTTIVGMKLFADFLLHSLTGYRDDDDEVTAESVALALMSNFADTIFSSVLFGSDLYKLIMSVYKGEKYDGVSQSGIDSLKDMLSSVANVGSNVFQTIKGEETLNWEYFHTLGKQICLVFGIPLNNAEKIGKAVYYWTSDITSEKLFDSDVKRSNKQNIHRVETRMSAGDTEEAKEIVNAMIKDKISNGKTEKEAKQSVRTSFTQEYKPRYLEAVKNNNEAEIKNIRQLLLNTGVYGSLSDLDKSMAEWRKDLNKKE